MAIKQNDQAAASNQQQSFTQQTATAGTESQVDLLSRFTGATKGFMARTPHSQVLGAWVEALKKQTEADGIQSIVRIVPLDQQVLRTPFSVISVVATLDGAGDQAVCGYFNLIIEETGDRLESLMRKNENPGLGFRELLIPRVAGDLVREDKFAPAVRQFLAIELGMQPNTIIDMGTMTVNREARPQDTVLVRDVLQRAVAALQYQCKVVLNEADEFVVSFAGANQSGHELRTRVEINPAPVKTSTGLPVRSDMTATVTLSARQQNQSAGLMSGGAMKVAQLSAYMDLVYVGPRKIQAHQFAAEQETSQHYATKMVITDTTVNTGVTTPEYQLLALALAGEPLKTKSHLRAFQQHGHIDNLRDLDGLSAEMIDNGMLQAGMRVGTKDPAFDVNGFFRDFVHDVTRFFIHVPECGESTWIMSLVRDAAAGSKTALDSFFAAANNATGGHFQAEFQRLGGTQIGQVMPQRIPLGYYTNAAGVRADIRELDHLMVANWVADKELAKLYAWDDCFDPRKASTDERLHAHVLYMKDYLGDVVITDYATEVEIFGITIQALENAFTLAGAGFTPDYVFNEARVVPRAQQEWLQGGLSTTAFQQQGFQAPVYQSGPATFNKKW